MGKRRTYRVRRRAGRLFFNGEESPFVIDVCSRSCDIEDVEDREELVRRAFSAGMTAGQLDPEGRTPCPQAEIHTLGPPRGRKRR